MAARGKRKHVSNDEDQRQQNIKAFGTVGKANASNDGLKKRKVEHQRDATPPPMVAPAKHSKGKRKRAGDDEEDGKATTASTKRSKHDPPQGTADTPGKRTADLFSQLNLERRSAPIPFAQSGKQSAYTTPPDTPETPSNALPPELDQLVLLHAAFMSALSLWYAHNGSSSAVHVDELLPMISRTWKKRAVSLDDLRMLLAVGGNNDADFELRDFGRAGVQLIKQQPRGRATKRSVSFMDEGGLNHQFEDALQNRWETRKAASPKEDINADSFIERLPRVEIALDASVAKAAPLLARGQQRLAEIKASHATAQHNANKPIPQPEVREPSTQSVQNRGTSLLDRILAKQAHTASLPAGPTRDDLERKAALQRIEDISRVLDLLAAGRPRASFSMQAVTQQIQQSLRNPISKAEVERCLDLMASDITPGWVTLMRNGAMSGIVVTRSGKIDGAELRRRVQVAS